MTREEAQTYLINWIDNEIKEKGENAVALVSPKKGKDYWTYKEYKEAVINDTCLEDSNENPIDTVLNYDKYLVKERGYGLFKSQM